MAKDSKGAVAKAIDIVQKLRYSSVVNAYVMTDDEHTELLQILYAADVDTGDASDSTPDTPEAPEEPKKPKKKKGR
jgi:hypothetical protein